MATRPPRQTTLRLEVKPRKPPLPKPVPLTNAVKIKRVVAKVKDDLYDNPFTRGYYNAGQMAIGSKDRWTRKKR